MLMRFLSPLLALLLIAADPVAGLAGDKVDLGPFSWADLDSLVQSANFIADPGERLVALSEPFLATPYVAHTLVGGPDMEEQLVLDLAGLDCFTFLDTLEALRRSAAADDLLPMLRQVRYRGGVVAYAHRRHFFSDWVADEDPVAIDVTPLVGQGREKVVVKDLNRKSDGSLWLTGIPGSKRKLYYFPIASIDDAVLSRMRAGDFLGIYSERAGLDVSHVGLLLRREGKWMLRHASSRSSAMQVVDDDLLDYLRGKPGVVVYRAAP